MSEQGDVLYDRALEVALRSPASDGVLVFTMQGALDPEKLARTIARFAATDPAS